MQAQSSTQNFSLLFYNAENLFDTKDDSLTQDDEFLPGGMKHWTYSRFELKLNKLSKVIMASNGFHVPDIVAMCEVENRFVLEQLLLKTPLKSFNYHIIHKDSPDERGIDVALLYLAESVKPLWFEYLPLLNEQGEIEKTREILHAVFELGGDTLHVFVNHWPSRYQGQADTEAARILAATTLKAAVDKVQHDNKHAKIAIVGDFNDTPENESLLRGLKTVPKDDENAEGELINLSVAWSPNGTIKHQQSWQVFDQIIVSGSLIQRPGLNCAVNDVRIVALPFLFEEDPVWGGKRLFRTYQGYDYTGGFSDHLPVLLRLTTQD